MAATAATKSGTKNDTDELKAEVAKLRKELSDIAKHVSDVGDMSARTARKAATTKAEELRKQGEAAFDELRESALGYEKQLTASVREKPVTSLAIAAGVGFLLALLARR
ncbi:MAG: DUF883 domain-containing protein [Rhizobiaceae bacterium]|nr:DUF883 domain-containing protein [Rhizobiaceae bacterium]